ncbi:RING-H2 finger protein ATL67 [Cucumis sativus]|uniref:RING-H2 finger protein ATL67 n=1 Tax=Cucumis sativus TaxID=3659 RepID=UPI0012F52632|nr:RING-H2 finger protein ATL67 [Cucumis sativus]
MPLSPSPLPPLHSPILLPGFFMVLMTVSMLLLIVLFLFIAILCTKRSAKYDGEESSDNLDIEAPIFHYSGVESGEQECAICLCEIEEGEKCRKMKTCGHVFHKDCIDRWFKVNGHCPICRTSVCMVVIDRGGNAMASSSSLPTPFINRI